MTAPASIPALIAEGRRLIAAATPGPLFPFAVNNLPALLDVAEAAAAIDSELVDDPDQPPSSAAWIALDAALSKLRGVRS